MMVSSDPYSPICGLMHVRASPCEANYRRNASPVYGTLDSEPLNDYDGKIGLGSELAVSFSQIREHKQAV
jgi:hypothetical protein